MFLLAIISLLIFAISINIQTANKQKEEDTKTKEQEELEEQQQAILEDIKDSYNSYVKTITEINLYKLVDNEYVEAGSLSSNMEITLKEKDIENYEDIYFQLENLDYYVKYTDVEPIESIDTDDYYKNYISFNKNVISKNPAILYDDNGGMYVLNEELSLPIIIKEDDCYYIEYDNKLLYIKKDDVKDVIDSDNTTAETASNIAVIAYHYTYDSSAGEKCLSTLICHDVTQVSSQFEYLNENNFYTTTLKDLELFLDGKIRLPKKSVTITVDDGWWFDRMYTLANEYKVNVTLFFIGNLQNNANILAYSNSSKYVQFASHTYDLHDIGVCSGGQGSPLKCLEKETILADLKKSREQLNNTTYFAWPFYEYNDYAIGLVKEAGFTMAFIGGMYKAYPGVNMFTVPRYTIHNETTVKEFASYIN